MTQTPCANLRALVRTAIATSGPHGITLDQLSAAARGFTRNAVNIAANDLARHSSAHKVGNGRWGAVPLRFFATAAAAQAWLLRNPGANNSQAREGGAANARLAAALEIKRRHEAQHLAHRRSGQTAGDAIVTEHTRRTVAPPPPDRYASTEPIVGGFAALGPGRYEHSSAWVRALTQRGEGITEAMP